MSLSKTRVAPHDSYMYNYSDMKRHGPGLWTSFMLNSINAENRTELLFVCKQIRGFSVFCKCASCKVHCTAYLKDNPPETAAVSNVHLFNYIVTFMNAVNIRLNKPIYDRDYLLRIFLDEELGVCTSNCGEGGTPVSQSRKSTIHTKAPARGWYDGSTVHQKDIYRSSYDNYIRDRSNIR